MLLYWPLPVLVDYPAMHVHTLNTFLRVYKYSLRRYLQLQYFNF